MALIDEVAKYIVRTDLSQFSPEVIEKSKYCILDSIGCGLYGHEFEATQILYQLAEECGGRPEASILGTDTQVHSSMAAKVNGVAVHVADFDDVSVYFRGEG